VITSEEQFNQIISPEYKHLAVIDIHLHWCGPCTVMSHNYKTLYYSFDEAEKRLQFWTCDVAFVPQEVKEELNLEVTCKPKFLIYCEGELKGNIDGADYTKVEQVVTTYIPSLDE